MNFSPCLCVSVVPYPPRRAAATRFAINPAIHSIRCYWRDKPEFSSGDDFDTGDSKHKVWFRFMESQYTDWRGIDGSQGA